VISKLQASKLKTLATCFILGFASGLPLALVSTTLQAWYTKAGISIISIGFLGLVAQPYVYKFIWAPVLDKHKLITRMSPRKDWILVMQICLLASVFSISFYEPTTDPSMMACIACIIAFFSATQDIAIDAYRTDILSEELRGLGAAIAISGYRLGMIASGGLALIMADAIGWKLTYQINACLVLLGGLGIWFGPTLKRDADTLAKMRYLDAFRDIMKRKHLISILLLILTYRLGESFTSSVSSLITSFLLRELDLTLTSVGILTKGVGIAAAVFGGLVGGYIMMRLSLYKALLYFGYFQAVSNLLFIILSKYHTSLPLVALVIGIENICSGLGTAAFIAFIMSLCRPPFTASQFALFSALSATNRIFIAPLSGYIVEYFGWTDYFIVSFIAAFPAIFIIYLMKRQDTYAFETTRISHA
jgi:PAT family beta-lactamase induction signal transducer AmpG